MKIFFGRQIDSLAANSNSPFRLGSPDTPSKPSNSDDIVKINGEIERLKHLFDDKFS
jgi:hypothetical protein